MPYDYDNNYNNDNIARTPYFQKIQQLALDEGQLPLLPVLGSVVFVLVVGGGFVVLCVRQGVQRRIERLVGRIVGDAVGRRRRIGSNAVGLPQSSVGHRNGERRAAQCDPDEGRNGRIHDAGGEDLLQSAVFAQ